MQVLFSRVVVGLGGALLIAVSVAQPAAARQPARRHAHVPRQQVSVGPPSPHHVAKRGDTLAAILRTQRLSEGELAQWATALRRDGWPVRPPAGNALNFEFDTAGRLAAVRYEADEHTDLVMRRVGTALRGTRERIAVRTTLARADFVVRRGLLADARTAGLPDAVSAQFSHAFGEDWGLQQVRRGDRVRVIYERRLGRGGRPIRPGKIIAAEVTSGGRAQQAFLYNEAGRDAYVDAHGRVLTRNFLRYPVEFTRITSVFTEERFHPILREVRPHNGVDLAAPVGTPVYAAADGVVSWADRYGGFGNHIAIAHGDGFVTTYSHLHNIAPAIRPGTVVRQGDLIGAVGSTGLSTGPHLHFALFQNDQYIDPLTAPVGFRSTVRDPRRFQAVRDALRAQFDAGPQRIAAAKVDPPMSDGLRATTRPLQVTATH